MNRFLKRTDVAICLQLGHWLRTLHLVAKYSCGKIFWQNIWQNILDTQENVSYTSLPKKKVLINYLNIRGG